MYRTSLETWRLEDSGDVWYEQCRRNFSPKKLAVSKSTVLEYGVHVRVCRNPSYLELERILSLEQSLQCTHPVPGRNSYMCSCIILELPSWSAAAAGGRTSSLTHAWSRVRGTHAGDRSRRALQPRLHLTVSYPEVLGRPVHGSHVAGAGVVGAGGSRRSDRLAALDVVLQLLGQPGVPLHSIPPPEVFT